MPFLYGIDTTHATENDRVKVTLEDGRVVMLRVLFIDDNECYEEDMECLTIDRGLTSRTILDELYESIREYEQYEAFYNSSWLTRRWRMRQIPCLRTIEFNSWFEVSLGRDMPVVGELLCILATLEDDMDPGNWWHSDTPIRSVEFTTLHKAP